MSVATILGFFGAFGLFAWAILLQTSNLTLFISFTSFLLVFGGTLAATFISYEPRYVLLSLKLIWKIIFTPKMGRDMLKSEVGRVIKWAYIVQKNGIPALEAESKKAVRGDRFLRFGIEMVLSGYTGAEVREILENTIEPPFPK